MGSRSFRSLWIQRSLTICFSRSVYDHREVNQAKLRVWSAEMAQLTQLQSAVLHSDSQTRPAVPNSGHQLPAAYGCGTAVPVPRLPQCGRHRLPALHEGGPPVHELQPAPSDNHCQLFHDVAKAPLPTFPCCSQGMPRKSNPAVHLRIIIYFFMIYIILVSYHMSSLSVPVLTLSGHL